MRNLFWFSLILLSTLSFCASGQAVGDYRSAGVGPASWNAVTSWQRFNGTSWVTPGTTPVTSDGVITIQSGHTINVTATVAADQIVVNGSLIVLDNSGLTISGASGITVNSGGILEKQEVGNTASITGTTASNTAFNSGATYRHNYTTATGAPPTATWNSNSTLNIVGYTGNITIAGASWSQTFGHVIYNCPNQANGTVNFAGLLTTIAGNLTISATTTAGTGSFRFNNTGTGTSTSITGDLIVSGASRMFLTSTGSHSVTVGGNFSFSPTTANTSQLSTSGTGNLTIGGTAAFSANNFTMTSAAAGVANITVNNNNSLTLSGGTLILCSLASTGTVTLNGGDFLYTGGALTYATTGTGSITLNKGTGTGNFSMSSSGTMNFASGAGSGTLNLNGGSFNATNGTVTETSTGSGNINFTGSGAAGTFSLTAPATMANTINFGLNRSSGSLTLQSDLTIAGSLTVTTGTVDLNGKTLSLNGAIAPNNWTTSSASLTTSSSSSLSIGGAGALPTSNMAFPGATFTTFTVNRAGTLITNSNFSASTFNLTTATVTYGGTATIGSLNQTSGTFTNNGNVTATNLTLTAGNFANNSTLNIANNGSITRAAGTLTGTALIPVGVYDLVYTNGAAINTGLELTTSLTGLRNLTKQSGAASVTLASAPHINGTLTITTNTLAGSTFNIDVAGDFVCNGTFTHSATSTFTFTGNSAHALSGTLAANCTFGNLSVNGTLTVSKNFIIGGTTQALAIQPSSSLTASAGTCTFTVAGGGTATVTNNGTLNFNAVTITGGGTPTTLVAPSSIMGIAGNFTSTGVFSANGGTVLFNGTTVLSASEVYKNVSVTGSVTAANINQTIGGNLVNNGTFTICNTTAAPAAGNLTWSGSGTLSGSGNTTIADLSVTGTSFTSTASGNLTMNDDLTGTGSFDATGSGGVVTFAGTASAISNTSASKSFNNLSISGTMTPAAGIDYSIDGNLTVSGSLVAATGVAITTFGNGGASTASAISGAGAINFGYLTISNGHTLTSSTGTVGVTGNLTISGSFVHNSGTIQFSTAGTKTISGNSSTFNNIVVGNGAVSTTVTNSLTPLSLAGRLTLNTAVVNTFNTSNNLVLLSTADNNTTEGSIGPLTGVATSVLNGNYTAQRHMDSENRIWRYVAAPVVGASVATLQAAFPISGTFADPSPCPSCPPSPVYNPNSVGMYYYNETTQAYVAYPSSGTASSNPLQNGKGYSVFVRQDGLPGPATINFTGSHPSSAGVSLVTGIPANGFALVGNPYPSAIVWDPAGPGYTGTANVVTTAKVRNNGTGGPAFVDVAPGGIIAIGQAFWVTATASGGGAVQINESAKTASASTFYRTDAPINDEIVINLRKTSNGISDFTTIRKQEGSLGSLDNFDSQKWNNIIQGGANQFDLSTLTDDNISVSTNSIPTLSCSQTIKLKLADLLVSETTAEYTFTFNPQGSFGAMTWTLHDNHLGIDKDLTSDPVYVFSVDNAVATTKAPDRFYLKVSNTPLNTTIQVNVGAQVCDSNDGAITIVGSQQNMMYGIEVNGTNFYPNLAQGTGSDLNIPVKSSWLNSGANSIKVKASSGCDVQYLTSVVSLSKDALLIVNSQNVTTCQSSPVTFAASGASNQSDYRWYASEISTTLLGTGDKFVTPTLTADSTSYYVTALNASGCEGPRVLVTAYVKNAVEINVQTSTNEVCALTPVTLTATASKGISGQFKWYQTATATDPLLTTVTTPADSVSEFVTPALEKSTTYYVAFTNGDGCEGQRTEFKANVSNFSPVIGAESNLMNKLVCPNGSYTFHGSGAPLNSTYVWYDSKDSITPISEGDEFVTPPLIGKRSFFVAAKNELGCSTDRYPFQADVDLTNPSAGILYSYDNICLTGSSEVDVTGGAASLGYRLYQDIVSSDPVLEGREFTIDDISVDTTLYVAAVNSNGCEGSRQAVSIKPVKYPEPQITMVSSTELQSNALTGNQWYFNGELLIGQTNQELSMTSTGEYGLLVTTNGCQAWTYGQYVVTGLEDFSRTIQIYPNPTSDVLYLKVLDKDVVSAHLLDVKGEVIQNLDIVSEGNGWSAEMDVRHLGRGLYFLRIFSESKSVTHKVIIK